MKQARVRGRVEEDRHLGMQVYWFERDEQCARPKPERALTENREVSADGELDLEALARCDRDAYNRCFDACG